MVSKQVFTSDKVVVHYKKVHHYIRLQCKEHCVYTNDKSVVTRNGETAKLTFSLKYKKSKNDSGHRLY